MNKITSEQCIILLAALKAIADLDPEEDSEEGFNEWGEADCFGQAQKIAKAALKEVIDE